MYVRTYMYMYMYIVLCTRYYARAYLSPHARTKYTYTFVLVLWSNYSILVPVWSYSTVPAPRIFAQACPHVPISHLPFAFTIIDDTEFPIPLARRLRKSRR